MTLEVAMINVTQGVALTEDGQILPITNSYDEDGDDCDPAEAVACVAGPDKDGLWLSIDLRLFEKASVQ